LLWLGPVLFGGQVLLPVPLLKQIAPWGQPQPNATWNPLMWDAMAFFYPIKLLTAQAIKAGHLPLWNPTILCGTPLLADVQSAVLYPLHLLFVLLPVPQAFGWAAYLHLVLAGLYTLFWLRREGCSAMGSLLGAVTFALGGWSIAWLELPNFMATAVWFPLLLGWLAGADSRSWGKTAAYCTMIIGVMLVAGHLQVAFCCLLGAFLYAASHDLAERNFRRLLPFLLGSAMGLLLAAPQLLPARALSQVSHRSTQATVRGYDAFIRLGPLPASARYSHLANLVAPDFFGNPSHDLYLGLGEYSEMTAYVGILPLLLGLHALMGLRRNRKVAILAILVGVALLLAFGTPLNALFYFGVPGFARFGSPNRALVLFAVAWSGLVAFGWDRMMGDWVVGSLGHGVVGESPQVRLSVGEETVNPSPNDPTTQRPNDLLPWRKTLIVGAVVCAGAVVAGLLFYPAQNRSAVFLLFGVTTLLRLVLFFILAAGVPLLSQRNLSWVSPAALLLTALDLWTFGFGYNLTGPASALDPPERFTQALKNTVKDGRVLIFNSDWPLRKPPDAVLPPNLSVLAGVKEVGGYEGAYLLDYKQRINQWEGKDASPPTNGNMVMLSDPSAIENSEMLRQGAIQMIVSNYDLLAKTFSHELDISDSDRGWYLNPVLRPASRAEFFPHWPPFPNEAGSSLKINESAGNPNRVEIALPGGLPGFILLKDTMADGWQAEVDGKPTSPIPNTSVLQRVVPVGSQNRSVMWEYRPPSLALGWKLMGAGWVGVLLCWVFGLFASARPRREG
jgi:hypothetical protein